MKEYLLVAYLGIFQSMPYSLIAPLVPLQLLKRGLSQYVTGLFFSLYGFTQIVIPFLIHKLIKLKYNQIRILQVGTLTFTISLLTLGLARKIPDNHTFVAVSLLARFGQGAGSSIELSTLLNLISQKYKDKKIVMTRFYQIMKVVGVTAGPFLGGAFFNLLGYEGIFILVAILTFFKIFLELFLISVEQVESEQSSELRPSLFFTNIVTLFAVFNSYNGLSVAESLETVLPRKLKIDYNYNEQQVGFYFLAELLTACIFGLLYTFTARNKDGRNWLLLGGFISSLSHLLIGPSQLLGLPNKKEFVLSGMIINGLGFCLLNSFLYHELLRASIQSFPEYEGEVYQLVPIMVTIIQGIQHLFEPLSVSLLYKIFGFRYLQDFLTGFYLAFYLAFLMVTLHDRLKRKPIESQFRSLSQSENDPGEHFEHFQDDENEGLLKQRKSY